MMRVNLVGLATMFRHLGFDVSESEQEAWWAENPDEIDSAGRLSMSVWEVPNGFGDRESLVLFALFSVLAL